MTTSCSDVCEYLTDVLLRMGFPIDTEDESYEDVMSALDKVVIFKSRGVGVTEDTCSTGRCFRCEWGLTDTYQVVAGNAQEHIKQGCPGPVIAILPDGPGIAGMWN